MKSEASSNRTKQGLRNLADVNTLYMYLYSDPENRFIYNNGIIDLEVMMTDNFELKWRKYDPDNSSDCSGFTDCSSILTLPELLEVIDILKDTPYNQSDKFSSTWDKIKFDVSIVNSLNRL